ncbi:MAG: vWA domain-containing protein, partial [Thermoleophilia bacterium]
MMTTALAEPGLQRLVGFGRLLRQRGLPVGTGRILTFCRAVAALDRLDRKGVYWAGRVAMVARKEDLAAYDAAFDEYFPTATTDALAMVAGWGPQTPGTPELEILLDQGFAEEAWEPAEGAEDGEGIVGVLASGAEVLRTRSFDELSETERIAADHVIRALAVHLPTRHSRRYRPSPYGRRFDQRRTLRASLRTQGEPFRRAWRDRRRRVRPLVLILDVSGSMSAYSRALMQFGFAAMRAGRRVEVFCFGTRLTRVTRALARSEPDDALREVAAAVVDWNGGTRIGASLKELLDRWSQHVAMRGAVVVLCSDGLERGDPALLAAQVARLSRLAHRLIWVN